MDQFFQKILGVLKENGEVEALDILNDKKIQKIIKHKGSYHLICNEKKISVIADLESYKGYCLIRHIPTHKATVYYTDGTIVRSA